LLRAQRAKAHTTGHQELFDLRAVVERDLKDASIEELSADRRFATAYNAVLQLTTMVIACAGYRVVGLGHHQTAFAALEVAMGTVVRDFATYFDACRRKRNQVDYDFANAATDTEAKELLQKAHEFHRLVEHWIREKHPRYGI